jgi:hypothetical protein
MAAPQFVPISPVDRPRSYESPEHVPGPWEPDRPGDLEGRQPQAPRLGFQGPDQGYGLVLANRFRGRLHLGAGETEDDAVQGCLAVALRRASLFGRAPVVHDLTLAFTVWGYLDPAPPADLVAFRRPLFAGVGHPAHHYLEWRRVADQVPEATLRMTHQAAAGAYPAGWRELVGA